jgi:hypothetical protein
VWCQDGLLKVSVFSSGPNKETLKQATAFLQLSQLSMCNYISSHLSLDNSTSLRVIK